MEKQRRRRIVQPRTARTVSESGQELVELPRSKQASGAAGSTGGRPQRAPASPESPGEGEAPDAADIAALEAHSGGSYASLPALSNEQIEERLRKLAGVGLDVLERLTRTVATGGKAPRNAQSIAMTAQWAVMEARKVAKQQESSAADKAKAAKLDKARAAFTPAALSAELQQRKLAEQGKLDS